MPVSDTLIDTLFDGRYRIVSKLGAGGMANVYLAEDQELGRRVAIKILNERHANDEQFVERFRREAKSAAGLSHPNIVSIYDRGEAEGTYYIAMEHLDGRNLKELIVSRGPAPVRVAVEYARQILGALRFAHRNGIVHRDIKPHNVLLDGEGRLKVTDFGIARAGASQMTEAGSIVGTAQYLSPEQARGTAVDARSDLYSLGIVLYELLTGSVPFTGDTPVEIAMKHLNERPSPPSRKRSDVPRDLDLVVMRALAKNPDDRYQNAEEMDADLDRVARGLPVAGRTEETATQVISGTGAAAAPTAVVRPRTARTQVAPQPAYYDYQRPRRRRPLWPWLLALGLVVAAATAGWYVYDQIQDELAENEPVAVPNLTGLRAEQAVNLLVERELAYEVTREPNAAQPAGFVFGQDPGPGDRIDRQTDTVTLLVSTGKPTVTVPDVRGSPRDAAVAELSGAKLDPHVALVFSDRPEGTVVAQDPAPSEVVEEGSTVRINVSQGLRPVTIPAVEGQAFESARSTLQAAGFEVAREDVDSNQPEGTVLAQDPSSNTTAPKGTTVTLTVSRGPQTTEIPDVTSFQREDAAATLRAAGFKVSVERQDTDDPSLDNVVLTQFPEGGTDADPRSTVAIIVGRFVAPPPETVPTTTETLPPTTETVPTETVPTETVPSDTIPTGTIP
jgi:serine/threonine-protein kinase